LPHLRNAVYHHLLKAEHALTTGSERAEVRVRDFNLDQRPEIALGNRHLRAYVQPHRGGHIYELDLFSISHNLLATLSRRPEVYHRTILEVAGVSETDAGWKALHEQVKFKQKGLDQLLFYDRYTRKSLVDHFYEPHTSLQDLCKLREVELGDFVEGEYRHEVLSKDAHEGIGVRLERGGRVGGASVHLAKELFLPHRGDTLKIRYILSNLPPRQRLHFAVEFQFAGMAAGADDRYFYTAKQPRAGQLQTLQDLPDHDRIGLVDEWLGLDASLSLSRPGGIWAFPIQTVSQSEGGFELVHQSTAVLPHWHIEDDGSGRWEVTLDLRLRCRS
jgi:alpha-amylase